MKAKISHLSDATTKREFRINRRALALILMVPLLVFSLAGAAQASTPAIDKAKAELQALSELVSQLDNELGAATEDYNYANQQLEDTQAAVKKTTAELSQAEEDLASAQDRLGQRLVAIYMAGKPSVLSVILNASSFTDLITSLDQFSRISEQDTRLVDQVETYQVQMADQKAELDSEMQQQTTYAAQAAGARQAVLDQLAKQAKALKGKETQLAQLRKEEAARQAKLAAEAKAAAVFAASRPGRVVKAAMGYLGVPYVWGGSSPSGFDCSGLVLYVYAKVGVTLPHSSRMQYSCGKPVSRSELKVGDLVFYYHPIQHVGIYIGNGKIVNATGNQVQISAVFQSGYYGACRIL
jgi:peptidoglycan DL-endopeptidase CwlO